MQPKVLQVRGERSAQDYQMRSQRSHIYKAPETWLGYCEHKERSELSVNERGEMVKVNLTTPPCISHLLYEILSNAVDNADSSLRMGVNPGSIEVEMNDEWISVTNYGEPIPIVPHLSKTQDSLRCVTVPEVVFGVLLTSNNYDDKAIRLGIGRNGYGAKLVNIFSTSFIVEAGDAKRGQLFRGEWSHNMTQLPASERADEDDVRDPSVEITPGYTLNKGGEWIPSLGPKYTGPSYVRIMWKLDFERFEMTGYTPQDFGIFKRMCYEFSWTCKIPFTFSSPLESQTKISLGLKGYASLFWSGESLGSSLIHRQWCKVDVLQKLKKGESVSEVNVTTIPAPEALQKLKGEKLEARIISPKSVEEIPMVELLILFTPGEGKVISFVNGMISEGGGVHVKKTFEQLSTPFLDKINKKNSLRNKGAESEVKLPTLTVDNFKKHVSFILSVRTPETKYDSQAKKTLTSLKTPIEVDPKVIESMMKWDIESVLWGELLEKNNKLLSSTMKRKKGRVPSNKLTDANDAAEGKNQDKCTLYIVEGHAASLYIETRINLSRDGLNKNGCLQLKGKPLNISDTSFEELIDNKEFELIVSALGLEEGMDYMIPQNFDRLRYNNIIISTDADTDGSHIRLLVLNLFHKLWPSILERGMVSYLMTPAVRVMDGGKCVALFYSEREYEEYYHTLDEVTRKRQKVNFYKGLGTSKNSEIKDDMQKANVVICVADETTTDSLNLAFDPKKAEDRKNWIEKWSSGDKTPSLLGRAPDDYILKSATYYSLNSPKDPPICTKLITSSVNYDLHDYAIDNLFRSIPSWMDGLKKSQRQIMYHFLKSWDYGKSTKGEEKIAVAIGIIISSLHYHHGDKSLESAIIKMAQNFVGSNNLNLLKPVGQFGSRIGGTSKSSPARYISTKPEDWVKLAFNREMIDIIERRSVDGDKVEPYWIPCDIPLAIINGSQGIATGWSSVIPPHDPREVIKWLIARCQYNLTESQDIQQPDLLPYFHGFTGETYILSHTPTPVEVEELEDEDGNEVKVEVKKGRRVTTQGIFSSDRVTEDSWRVTVTELPVGVWNDKYESWLKSLLEKEFHPAVLEPQEGSKPTKSKKKKEYILGSYTYTRDVENKPTFTLEGLRFEPTLDSLHLRKSLSMENMVLIDRDGAPRRYDSVYELIEVYWNGMISCYTSLKESRLKSITEEVQETSTMRKLITLLVERTVIIEKESDESIASQLLPHSIPISYLDKINVRQLTLDKISKLELKLTQLEETRRVVESTSPEELWIQRLEQLLKHITGRYGY
jgi:DNA topoisomerase II